MIVTFYSYKGGVGRSMALANVACQLAHRHGLRVLVIDWDLEAPGLHFYFGLQDRALKKQRGILDLLELSRNQAHIGGLERFIIQPSQRIKRKIQFGSVDILPCGRLDDLYMERVADFNWASFYDENDGYDHIEGLKEQINAQYEICLIDARAGQADTNVAPTTQLADALVLLFTSNSQSLTGTEQLCRRFHDVRSRSAVPAQIPILLVPSRVFPFQPTYQRWLIDAAEPMYRRLADTGIVSRRHQPNGLAHVTLPVEAACAAGEQLPVLNPEVSGSGLVAAYRELVELLLDLKNNDDMLWRPDRLLNGGNVSENVVARLRDDLKDAADRGDEVAAATIRLRLARYLRVFDRYSEAESLALSSLTYLRSRNDLTLQPLAMHTLGQIDYARGAYSDAIGHYEEALSLIQTDDIPKAVLLHDLAVVHHRLSDISLALMLLHKSVSIRERLGDQLGLALSMHLYGNIALTEGKSDEATTYFEKAVDLAMRSSDELGAAISLHQLGNVRARAKDYSGALAYFHKSLQVHVNRKDLRGSAITRRRIGDMYADLNDPEQALIHYSVALETAHAEGDLRSTQALNRRIGDSHLRLGQFDTARDNYLAALGLAEGLGLSEDLARTLLRLSRLELKLGRRGPAALYFERADTISRSTRTVSLDREVSAVKNLLERDG